MLRTALQSLQHSTVKFNEIIVVDDYSIDGSREILLNKISKQISRLVLNDKNYGKGYSVNRGIEFSSGDIIIIQDADLEYDPKDYNNLIKLLFVF